MSFLTAASERSSSGSGVSGVSDASFSGVSSFSFSFCAVLALLAIRPLLETPRRGDADHHTTPTLCGRTRMADWERRFLPAPLAIRPIRTRGVSPGPLKPRLSLHCNKSQRLSPGSTLRATLGFPSSQQSQRPYWPPRGGSKTLDQRLGSIEYRQPSLHILQPGIVGLGRILSQGLFSVPEFLN